MCYYANARDTAVRSGAFRAVYSAIADRTDAEVVLGERIVLSLARSLEREPRYIWERVQALKIVRQLMQLAPDVFPFSLLRSLVAIASYAGVESVAGTPSTTNGAAVVGAGAHGARRGDAAAAADGEGDGDGLGAPRARSNVATGANNSNDNVVASATSDNLRRLALETLRLATRERALLPRLAAAGAINAMIDAVLELSLSPDDADVAQALLLELLSLGSHPATRAYAPPIALLRAAASVFTSAIYGVDDAPAPPAAGVGARAPAAAGAAAAAAEATRAAASRARWAAARHLFVVVCRTWAGVFALASDGGSVATSLLALLLANSSSPTGAASTSPPPSLAVAVLATIVELLTPAGAAAEAPLEMRHAFRGSPPPLRPRRVSVYGGGGYALDNVAAQALAISLGAATAAGAQQPSRSGTRGSTRRRKEDDDEAARRGSDEDDASATQATSLTTTELRGFAASNEAGSSGTGAAGLVTAPAVQYPLSVAVPFSPPGPRRDAEDDPIYSGALWLAIGDAEGVGGLGLGYGARWNAVMSAAADGGSNGEKYMCGCGTAAADAAWTQSAAATAARIQAAAEQANAGTATNVDAGADALAGAFTGVPWPAPAVTPHSLLGQYRATLLVTLLEAGLLRALVAAAMRVDEPLVALAAACTLRYVIRLTCALLPRPFRDGATNSAELVHLTALARARVAMPLPTRELSLTPLLATLAPDAIAAALSRSYTFVSCVRPHIRNGSSGESWSIDISRPPAWRISEVLTVANGDLRAHASGASRGDDASDFFPASTPAGGRAREQYIAAVLAALTARWRETTAATAVASASAVTSRTFSDRSKPTRRPRSAGPVVVRAAREAVSTTAMFIDKSQRVSNDDANDVDTSEGRAGADSSLSPDGLSAKKPPEITTRRLEPLYFTPAEARRYLAEFGTAEQRAATGTGVGVYRSASMFGDGVDRAPSSLMFAQSAADAERSRSQSIATPVQRSMTADGTDGGVLAFRSGASNALSPKPPLLQWMPRDSLSATGQRSVDAGGVGTGAAGAVTLAASARAALDLFTVDRDAAGTSVDGCSERGQALSLQRSLGSIGQLRRNASDQDGISWHQYSVGVTTHPSDIGGRSAVGMREAAARAFIGGRGSVAGRDVLGRSAYARWFAVTGGDVAAAVPPVFRPHAAQSVTASAPQVLHTRSDPFAPAGISSGAAVRCVGPYDQRSGSGYSSSLTSIGGRLLLPLQDARGVTFTRGSRGRADALRRSSDDASPLLLGPPPLLIVAHFSQTNALIAASRAARLLDNITERVLLDVDGGTRRARAEAALLALGDALYAQMQQAQGAALHSNDGVPATGSSSLGGTPVRAASRSRRLPTQRSTSSDLLLAGARPPVLSLSGNVAGAAATSLVPMQLQRGISLVCALLADMHAVTPGLPDTHPLRVHALTTYYAVAASAVAGAICDAIPAVARGRDAAEHAVTARPASSLPHSTTRRRRNEENVEVESGPTDMQRPVDMIEASAAPVKTIDSVVGIAVVDVITSPPPALVTAQEKVTPAGDAAKVAEAPFGDKQSNTSLFAAVDVPISHADVAFSTRKVSVQQVPVLASSIVIENAADVSSRSAAVGLSLSRSGSGSSDTLQRPSVGSREPIDSNLPAVQNSPADNTAGGRGALSREPSARPPMDAPQLAHTARALLTRPPSGNIVAHTERPSRTGSLVDGLDISSSSSGSAQFTGLSSGRRALSAAEPSSAVAQSDEASFAVAAPASGHEVASTTTSPRALPTDAFVIHSVDEVSTKQPQLATAPRGGDSSNSMPAESSEPLATTGGNIAPSASTRTMATVTLYSPVSSVTVSDSTATSSNANSSGTVQEASPRRRAPSLVEAKGEARRAFVPQGARGITRQPTIGGIVDAPASPATAPPLARGASAVAATATTTPNTAPNTARDDDQLLQKASTARQPSAAPTMVPATPITATSTGNAAPLATPPTAVGVVAATVSADVSPPHQPPAAATALSTPAGITAPGASGTIVRLLPPSVSQQSWHEKRAIAQIAARVARAKQELQDRQAGRVSEFAVAHGGGAGGGPGDGDDFLRDLLVVKPGSGVEARLRDFLSAVQRDATAALSAQAAQPRKPIRQVSESAAKWMQQLEAGVAAGPGATTSAAKAAITPHGHAAAGSAGGLAQAATPASSVAVGMSSTSAAGPEVDSIVVAPPILGQGSASRTISVRSGMTPATNTTAPLPSSRWTRSNSAVSSDALMTPVTGTARGPSTTTARVADSVTELGAALAVDSTSANASTKAKDVSGFEESASSIAGPTMENATVDDNSVVPALKRAASELQSKSKVLPKLRSIPSGNSLHGPSLDTRRHSSSSSEDGDSSNARQRDTRDTSGEGTAPDRGVPPDKNIDNIPKVSIDNSWNNGIGESVTPTRGGALRDELAAAATSLEVSPASPPVQSDDHVNSDRYTQPKLLAATTGGSLAVSIQPHAPTAVPTSTLSRSVVTATSFVLARVARSLTPARQRAALGEAPWSVDGRARMAPSPLRGAGGAAAAAATGSRRWLTALLTLGNVTHVTEEERRRDVIIARSANSDTIFRPGAAPLVLLLATLLDARDAAPSHFALREHDDGHPVLPSSVLVHAQPPAGIFPSTGGGLSDGRASASWSLVPEGEHEGGPIAAVDGDVEAYYDVASRRRGLRPNARPMLAHLLRAQALHTSAFPSHVTSGTATSSAAGGAAGALAAPGSASTYAVRNGLNNQVLAALAAVRVSKVVAVRDWRLWDWGAVAVLLDHHLTQPVVLGEILVKTAFMHRLGDFFARFTSAAAGGDAGVGAMTTIPWLPSSLRFVRAARQWLLLCLHHPSAVDLLQPRRRAVPAAPLTGKKGAVPQPQQHEVASSSGGIVGEVAAALWCALSRTFRAIVRDNGVAQAQQAPPGSSGLSSRTVAQGVPTGTAAAGRGFLAATLSYARQLRGNSSTTLDAGTALHEQSGDIGGDNGPATAAAAAVRDMLGPGTDGAAHAAAYSAPSARTSPFTTTLAREMLLLLALLASTRTGRELLSATRSTTLWALDDAPDHLHVFASAVELVSGGPPPARPAPPLMRTRASTLDSVGAEGGPAGPVIADDVIASLVHLGAMARTEPLARHLLSCLDYSGPDSPGPLLLQMWATAYFVHERDVGDGNRARSVRPDASPHVATSRSTSFNDPLELPRASGAYGTEGSQTRAMTPRRQPTAPSSRMRRVVETMSGASGVNAAAHSANIAQSATFTRTRTSSLSVPIHGSPTRRSAFNSDDAASVSDSSALSRVFRTSKRLAIYATSFTRALLRRGTAGWAVWAVDLLVQQLRHADLDIAVAALDVLTEAAATARVYRLAIVAAEPQLTRFRENAVSPLVSFLVSEAAGLALCLSQSLVAPTMRTWLREEHVRYAIAWEAALVPALTTAGGCVSAASAVRAAAAMAEQQPSTPAARAAAAAAARVGHAAAALLPHPSQLTTSQLPPRNAVRALFRAAHVEASQCDSSYAGAPAQDDNKSSNKHIDDVADSATMMPYVTSSLAYGEVLRLTESRTGNSTSTKSNSQRRRTSKSREGRPWPLPLFIPGDAELASVPPSASGLIGAGDDAFIAALRTSDGAYAARLDLLLHMPWRLEVWFDAGLANSSTSSNNGTGSGSVTGLSSVSQLPDSHHVYVTPPGSLGTDNIGSLHASGAPSPSQRGRDGFASGSFAAAAAPTRTDVHIDTFVDISRMLHSGGSALGSHSDDDVEVASDPADTGIAQSDDCQQSAVPCDAYICGVPIDAASGEPAPCRIPSFTSSLVLKVALYCGAYPVSALGEIPPTSLGVGGPSPGNDPGSIGPNGIPLQRSTSAAYMAASEKAAAGSDALAAFYEPPYETMLAVAAASGADDVSTTLSASAALTVEGRPRVTAASVVASTTPLALPSPAAVTAAAHAAAVAIVGRRAESRVRGGGDMGEASGRDSRSRPNGGSVTAPALPLSGVSRALSRSRAAIMGTRSALGEVVSSAQPADHGIDAIGTARTFHGVRDASVTEPLADALDTVAFMATRDEHSTIESAASKLRNRTAAAIAALAVPSLLRNPYAWASDAGLVETGDAVAADGARAAAVATLADVLSISGTSGSGTAIASSRLPDFASGGPDVNTTVALGATVVATHTPAVASARMRASVEKHARVYSYDVSVLLAAVTRHHTKLSHDDVGASGTDDNSGSEAARAATRTTARPNLPRGATWLPNGRIVVCTPGSPIRFVFELQQHHSAPPRAGSRPPRGSAVARDGPSNVSPGASLTLVSVELGVVLLPKLQRVAPLPPNLYRQLAATHQGSSYLARSGHIQALLKVAFPQVTRSVNHVDADDNTPATAVQRRASMLTLGFVCSSPHGLAVVHAAAPEFMLRVDAAARGLELQVEKDGNGQGGCVRAIADSSDDVARRVLAQAIIAMSSAHRPGHLTAVALGWAVPSGVLRHSESFDVGGTAAPCSGVPIAPAALIAVPLLPLAGYALRPGRRRQVSIDDGGNECSFLAAGRLPPLRPEWETIISHIGELASRITQRDARTALLRLKAERPDVFAASGLYMHVHALLARYTMVLPVRRFVHALFDRVSFSDTAFAFATRN